jgi:hypothetical protein
MSIRSGTLEPSEPVDSRAWCLQEQLLARRTLVYASHTLRYECLTDSVNIGNANEATWRWELQLPGILLQSDPPTFVTEKSLLEAENAWDTVISGYSKRGITDPRDKLVALYGIAEVFHRFWSTSKYLAGLWERNLLDELLWQKSEEDRFPRPAVYRAPSWSWAAIDGHITPAFSMHYWGEDKPECEILQCEVTLASDIMPFGEVTSGFLALNAVLKKILWDPAEGKMFALKTAVTDASETSPVNCQNALLGAAYPDSVEDVSNGRGQTWAIPLRSSSGVSEVVEGLIVVRGGFFRRVGVFQIPTRKPKGNTNIAAWLDTPKQNITII